MPLLTHPEPFMKDGRLMMSSAYEWTLMDDDGDLMEEEFKAGSIYFNITRAKRIILNKPRLIILTPVDVHAVFLEMFVDLDRRKLPDLDFPVILGTLRKGGTLLLDGWHRLDAALKAGRTHLQAVVLDRDETSKARKR